MILQCGSIAAYVKGVYLIPSAGREGVVTEVLRGKEGLWWCVSCYEVGDDGCAGGEGKSGVNGEVRW